MRGFGCGTLADAFFFALAALPLWRAGFWWPPAPWWAWRFFAAAAFRRLMKAINGRTPAPGGGRWQAGAVTTVSDDPIAIAEPYAHVADLAESWPFYRPPRGAGPQPDRIEVTAAVKPVLASASATAAEVRASLLAQAERLIAAYGEAGWLLAGAPHFEFGGSLKHARTTIIGVVYELPAEYGIGLTLRLTLIRTEEAAANKRRGPAARS